MISVAITTRNRPNLLRKCLDSILRQTLLPKEIIVVDASDNSEIEVLNDFKSKLPITYFHKPGLNAPQARNAALKNAAYNTVLFIDDDCMAEKDWFKKMLQLCKKYATAAIISSTVIQYPENGIYAKVINVIRSYRRKIADTYRNIYINIDNALFFRNKLNKNHIAFDEHLPREEDIDIALQVLLKKGKIVFADGPTVYHHARSTLSSFLLQRFLNAGNSIKLKKKWGKQIFYFYGSQRLRYLRPLILILKDSYKRGGIKGAIKLLGVILLSSLFYEIGFGFYTIKYAFRKTI